MGHIQDTVCARYLATRGPMGKAYNCNIMVTFKNKLDLEENQKAYKSNEEWDLLAIQLTVCWAGLNMETFFWFLVRNLSSSFNLFHIDLLNTSMCQALSLMLEHD